MSLLHAIDAASTGMTAQSLRLNATASNLANVDVASAKKEEAYHAKMPVFKTVLLSENDQTHGVVVKKFVDSNKPVKMVYEPNNPLSDKKGYVYYSNVDRIESLTNMISASQAYQSDAEVADTCKKLLLNTVAMMKG